MNSSVSPLALDTKNTGDAPNINQTIDFNQEKIDAFCWTLDSLVQILAHYFKTSLWDVVINLISEINTVKSGISDLNINNININNIKLFERYKNKLNSIASENSDILKEPIYKVSEDNKEKAQEIIWFIYWIWDLTYLLSKNNPNISVVSNNSEL